MIEYTIVISNSAKAELMKIIRYIAIDLMQREAAERLRDNIYDAMASLAIMPHRCPVVRDKVLALFGYRIKIVKNYNIFYTINEDENIIGIEHIYYKGEDWVSKL